MRLSLGPLFVRSLLSQLLGELQIGRHRNLCRRKIFLEESWMWQWRLTNVAAHTLRDHPAGENSSGGA
jgi:hypothetical protein